MYGGDDLNALVVEYGNGTIRVGWAGEDTPRVVMETTIQRRPRDKEKSTVVVKRPPEDADDVDMIPNGVHPSPSPSPSPSPLSSDYDYFFGGEERYPRVGSTLSPCVVGDVIVDMDAFASVVHQCITKSMGSDPNIHPILIVDPTWTPIAQRDTLASLLLHTFNCPAVFFGRSAVMSTIASAKSTAIVIDCGAAQTEVATVVDGILMAKSTRRTKFGANHVDEVFTHLLRTNNDALRQVEFTPRIPSLGTASSYDPSFHNYHRSLLVRDCREMTCKVSEIDLFSLSSRLPTVPYELPDGKTIEVGNERFQTMEFYFNPMDSLMEKLKLSLRDKDREVAMKGMKDIHNVVEKANEGIVPIPPPSSNGISPPIQYQEHNGIPQLFESALTSTVLDPSLLRELFSNIVLTGGIASTAGFVQRLTKELSQLQCTQNFASNQMNLASSASSSSSSASSASSGPSISRVKVQHSCQPLSGVNRHLSWIGGSIMASLGTFHQLWISKEEYDKEGKQVIMRKAQQ